MASFFQSNAKAADFNYVYPEWRFQENKETKDVLANQKDWYNFNIRNT